MSQSKVFVTGIGAITPSGKTINETWEALLSGKVALNEMQSHDLSDWSYRMGGEIDEPQLAKLLPDRKLLKLKSRQDVFGIYAATQAIQNSQILEHRDVLTDATEYNEATGIYVGSPGNKFYQQYDFLPLLAQSKKDMHEFADQLFDTVHPMWLLKILPNNVLAYVAITHGFKGANQNITNHAVGGSQALLEAYHAIKTGQIKRAVVIAYDVGIEPQALFYYQRLGVLSANHLKPFDAAHDGTILSEGAAAVVIESEASVQERNGTPYAEFLGGQTASEATGLFSIEEEGTALSALLTKTLTDRSITPDALAFIVAHGNGNPKSDISEARAITQMLQDCEVPVTAFKWSMGHTLCASGLLDFILMTKAIQTSTIPGISVLSQSAADCAGINLAFETQSCNQAYAMSINRGFGAMNASLLVKRCDR